jgi:hypothetical protein
MFRQLFDWLHVFSLYGNEQNNASALIPSKLLQIQRNDLHAFDKGALDIWSVREDVVVVRVAKDVEIGNAMVLMQDVNDTINPLERQPCDVC